MNDCFNECQILENLMQAAYEMTMEMGNGAEANSVEEALFTLVNQRLDHLYEAALFSPAAG